MAGDCDREPTRDPGEQRIAGGMSERVVVSLEAVEVEDDEDDRLLVAELRLEVGHEAAAVAKAGQRIGERLFAARGKQPDPSRKLSTPWPITAAIVAVASTSATPLIRSKWS